MNADASPKISLWKGLTIEWKLIRLLMPMVSDYRRAVVGILVLGVLSSLAEGIGISLLIPFLQNLHATEAGSGADLNSGSRLVDALGQMFRSIPPERRITVLAGAVFVTILLKTLLMLAHSLLYAWLDVRLGHKLRTGIFNQLLTVDYAFLENDPSGKLLNALSTETWRTSQALFAMLSLFINICTLLVFSILLLLISWQFTLLVAIAMLFVSWLVKLPTRRMRELSQQATQINAVLADRMLEGLWGMKVVRLFAREPHEQKRFHGASWRMSSVYFKMEVVGAAIAPIYEIFTAGMLVVILLSTLRSAADLPVVLVFIFVLYRLQPRIQALDSIRVNISSLSAGVEEVAGLLRRDDKPYMTPGTVPFQGLRDGVAFRDVSFTYPTGEAPALNSVSISVPAGKTTALVGPSGAGKSTIIDLFLRFYEPQVGEILLDGVPLRDVELSSWRSRVAVVSQDVYVFNTTIRENIAYGQLDATLEDVIAAAKQANAHDFITGLPQGYDTLIGDQGMRLSGGQKQRLTLARAIVRDPDVLILDEATNALDSISEHLIQQALDALSAERTVLVVAHRLSTIERADHIIVMEKGQVREEGNFQSLIERGGLFTQLYNLQYRHTQA